jgi:hypothetical protein
MFYYFSCNSFGFPFLITYGPLLCAKFWHKFSLDGEVHDTTCITSYFATPYLIPGLKVHNAKGLANALPVTRHQNNIMSLLIFDLHKNFTFLIFLCFKLLEFLRSHDKIMKLQAILIICSKLICFIIFIFVNKDSMFRIYALFFLISDDI